MPQECNSCLYDDKHPFGMAFKDGTCLGCLTHKEKQTLDWQARKDKLIQITHKLKRHSKTYDCVVPVVGDAEDYFTVNEVLDLGLRPLIVCVNDYFKNDIAWHNLHNLITHFDVDSFVFNPDMNVYKELVKTSLRKYEHVLLPFLQLHTSFPVHVAYERKIPMIIWGQHQAIEQVGKFSHSDEVEMSKWSRQQHDIFTVDIDKLMGNGAQVQQRYVNYYRYPNTQALQKRGTTGLYLSNYIPWDPLKQNYNALTYGFIPQRQIATFDIYDRAGSSIYYDLHDLLKLKRVGYRKCVDHLVREIRHQRIKPTHAQTLADHYMNTPVNIKPFFNWLGVTSSGYEWFIEHKLSGMKHLLSKEPLSESVKLTKKISDLLVNGESPQRSFILFGKGIDI
jgi:N-acetyl sugar amidotransferase